MTNVSLRKEEFGGKPDNFSSARLGMTESMLRSFSSSRRGVVRIPLGDKRKFEEGRVGGEPVRGAKQRCRSLSSAGVVCLFLFYQHAKATPTLAAFALQ